MIFFVNILNFLKCIQNFYSGNFDVIRYKSVKFTCGCCGCCCCCCGCEKKTMIELMNIQENMRLCRSMKRNISS